MLGVIISFAHMRAYAIRPYTCSIEFLAMLVCVLVSFSLAWGRMRYAPTPVQLNFWRCWFACWFHFRSHEGICDTPLHLFDWIPVDVGLCVCFFFAHMRAYAIRPYTCSIEFLAMLVCVLVSFSPTWGRMRYAPTFFYYGIGHAVNL